MSRSDFGSKLSVGLEHATLRERASFYAERNQIESAVFFAGNPPVSLCLELSFTHLCRASCRILKSKPVRRLLKSKPVRRRSHVRQSSSAV